MTWHSFLHAIFQPDLKNLPIAYALVLITQASYAGWIAWNWFKTETPGN